MQTNKPFWLLLTLWFALLSLPTLAHQREDHCARCTGSATCRACKNCHYCAYCAKGGGTCGVCKPEKKPVPKKAKRKKH